MWAAGGGKAETVKVLLAAGARTGIKDDRGLTALDMAREGKHLEVIALLESL
jgi:ankyrin repeat protein